MNEQQPDYQSFKQLNSGGNWAYFIGFYYIAVGFLILSFGVFTFINIDNATMLNYFGLSENVQFFLADTNKYLILLFCLLASFVVFLNAYLLIKFRGKAMSYFMTDNDFKLGEAYINLANYFRLNSFFTIVSIIVSIIAIIYYMLV